MKTPETPETLALLKLQHRNARHHLRVLVKASRAVIAELDLLNGEFRQSLPALTHKRVCQLIGLLEFQVDSAARYGLSKPVVNRPRKRKASS